jgi:hypothetical protein
MEALKMSLPLVSCLVGLIVAAEVRPDRSAQGPPARPRAFYVTQTLHTGAEALSACAEGYHMASLWEIFDTSNVRYNTELGLTQGDSGSGPPSLVLGWIRTGNDAHEVGAPGFGNCNAWTSDTELDGGTVVFLPSPWFLMEGASVSGISPWQPGAGGCATARNVWCVQD